MAGLDLSVDVGQRLGLSMASLDAPALAAVQEILWEIVYSWREVMQDSWPRDTGLSFSMWRSRVVGLRLEVENPVEYAEWVHPAGEEEGSAGEYLAEALDGLIDAAAQELGDVLHEAEARLATGFAAVAEQIGAPQQLGGGMAAAMRSAFTVVGGRARQRAVLGVVPPPLRERSVLAQAAEVLVRFRARTRVRARGR